MPCWTCVYSRNCLFYWDYFRAEDMHLRMIKCTSEGWGSVHFTAKCGYVWVGDRSEVSVNLGTRRI